MNSSRMYEIMALVQKYQILLNLSFNVFLIVFGRGKCCHSEPSLHLQVQSWMSLSYPFWAHCEKPLSCHLQNRMWRQCASDLSTTVAVFLASIIHITFHCFFRRNDDFIKLLWLLLTFSVKHPTLNCHGNKQNDVDSSL